MISVVHPTGGVQHPDVGFCPRFKVARSTRNLRHTVIGSFWLWDGRTIDQDEAEQLRCHFKGFSGLFLTGMPDRTLEALTGPLSEALHRRRNQRRIIKGELP